MHACASWNRNAKPKHACMHENRTAPLTAQEGLRLGRNLGLLGLLPLCGRGVLGLRLLHGGGTPLPGGFVAANADRRGDLA